MLIQTVGNLHLGVVTTFRLKVVKSGLWGFHGQMEPVFGSFLGCQFVEPIGVNLFVGLLL